MNTPEVVIRPALRTIDSAGLAEVYLSSARHHVALDPESYQVPEIDDVIARYQGSEGVQSRSAVFVADDGGRLIGSAEVRLVPEPDAASMLKAIPTAVIDIAVVEEARGGGTGERLMRAAEQWAEQHGARRMQLDAHAANQRALRFYRDRLGYQTFGVILTKTIRDQAHIPSQPT